MFATSAGSAALFVSDVHLDITLPHTTQAFLDFLQQQAIHTAQLYILGDLFEAWPGDDAMQMPYPQKIVNALRQLSDAGIALFWIGGNRDFLIGADFAAATGMTLLPDPTIINVAGQRIVLTHGDALCTDDTSYMAFRTIVRQPLWQAEFLAKPLCQRQQIIADLREGSKAAQQHKIMQIMDVNPQAVEQLFRQSNCQLMIHGHTHRPAQHQISYNHSTHQRYVLSDWDLDQAQRYGWLAMNAQGTLRAEGKQSTLPA